MMSKKNIIFCFLLLLSIVLVFIYYNKYKVQVRSNEKVIKLYQESYLKIGKENEDIYRNVFLKRNDSLYEKYFYMYYEDSPYEAYLLANSYYLLTKSDSVLKDVELAKEQLDEIYSTK
ncbi:hypothetical protein [Flavobacterium cerinum]|uniref:DUF4296 domain-containing protein n=1 Tax=Flavobacterium cerinum TaxID=2502784 RepID=A0ABY5IW99_9FLAO|nr:hypothetical protein [Flavobacterium cerinum]UUC46565.1 hypothetical protein NOX80_05030 [Flavobacterium cerinum]